MEIHRRLSMEQFLLNIFANVLAGVITMFVSFYLKR